MDRAVFSNEPTLKCKTPILILAIISLVATVIGCSEVFVVYETGSVYTNIPIVWRFHFPNVFTLLATLLRVAACVLLVMYAAGYYKKKSGILLPISLGAVAASWLFEIMVGLIFFGVSPVFSVFYILLAASFGIMTFFAFKGITKKDSKIFVIMSSVSGFMQVALGVYSIFLSIDFYLRQVPFFLVTNIAFIIGLATLYTAFLIHGLNNSFPAIIGASASETHTVVEVYDPEQELLALKQKLDLGIITEEEYQKQRNEIINRL